MALSEIKANIQKQETKYEPNKCQLQNQANNNNGIYTYTYTFTPMNKVKTVQQKESTVD